MNNCNQNSFVLVKKHINFVSAENLIAIKLKSNQILKINEILVNCNYFPLLENSLLITFFPAVENMDILLDIFHSNENINEKTIMAQKIVYTKFGIAKKSKYEST